MRPIAYSIPLVEIFKGYSLNNLLLENKKKQILLKVYSNAQRNPFKKPHQKQRLTSYRKHSLKS